MVARLRRKTDFGIGDRPANAPQGAVICRAAPSARQSSKTPAGILRAVRASPGASASSAKRNAKRSAPRRHSRQSHPRGVSPPRRGLPRDANPVVP